MMARRACLLIPPSARLVPYPPMLVAFGLGLVIVAFTQVDATAASQLPRLRGVTLLFAVAVVFAFDDPTADVADASPVPRRVRAMVRGGVQIVPAMTMWVAVLAFMSARTAAPVPAGRLGLEAAGMVLAGWAIALWWCRARGVTGGGVIAGPVLIVLVLVAYRLPPSLALFLPDPETPLWDDIQQRWVVLLAVAMAALGLALRDPLSRVRRRGGVR